MPRPRRKQIRLPRHDYSEPGGYFVTICAHDHRRLFGTVRGERMVLNAWGRIVEEEWHRTAELREYVLLDAFVVMPNHVHGVLAIQGDRNGRRGRARPAPTGAGNKPVRQFGRVQPASLPTVVGAFKSAVTRRINQARDTPGGTVWQRGYYDHVVRDGRDLDRIRQYIHENPARWHWDRYHCD